MIIIPVFFSFHTDQCDSMLVVCQWVLKKKKKKQVLFKLLIIISLCIFDIIGINKKTFLLF